MAYHNWNTLENQRFSDKNYATQELEDYSEMDNPNTENYSPYNRYDQNGSTMRSFSQHGTIGRASYGKNPYEQRYSEYPGVYSTDYDTNRFQGRSQDDNYGGKRMNYGNMQGRSIHSPSYYQRGNYGSSYYDDMGNQNFMGNSGNQMRSREELYGRRSHDDMAYQGRGFGGGLDRNYTPSYGNTYENMPYGREYRDSNSRGWYGRAGNESDRSFNERMGSYTDEGYSRFGSRNHQNSYNQEMPYGRSFSRRSRFSPSYEENNYNRRSEGRNYGMGRGNQGWDNSGYGMRSGQRNEADYDNYGRGYYNSRSYGTEGDYSDNW